MLSDIQKTILKSARIKGVGLHTGVITSLELKPALPNTGIVFKRTDINDNKKNSIKANFKNVSSAKLCTKIENSYGVSISTIEHLMAAFHGEGIDNIIVEVNNEEVPIMDGSAIPFVKLIRSTGLKKQNVSNKFIEVLKKVEVREGLKFISIEPQKRKLKIDFKLVYENDLIGSQREEITINKNNLEKIYSARTFCLYEDIEKIKSIGLAKGGSLENAVVVKGKKILNEGGLRDKNEFVKHKILDCLGDLMLSEHRIFGLIKTERGGHQLTNSLLLKFFSDSSNWRFASHEKEEADRRKNYNYVRPVAVSA